MKKQNVVSIVEINFEKKLYQTWPLSYDTMEGARKAVKEHVESIPLLSVQSHWVEVRDSSFPCEACTFGDVTIVITTLFK